MRGVAVHHAGLLPRYRRRVEELFQKKLLSVCVCTETLAAGINLPARSVVLTTLVKGPPGKKKLIESSTAHQIFGSPDDLKFRSCMTLFSLCADDPQPFQDALEKYFDGEGDVATTSRL